MWTRKGPVSQRTDMPDSIKDLALWFIDNHTRDEVVPEMLKAQDFFDLPIGVHWYSWHEVPFDTHYPDYYPTKPGFAEGVKELTDRGILAMPYINGRLHDMDIPSFPEAEPWCTKNESGENSMEVYPSQARQAIMCPYTEYWQKRINGVIERLVHESGVNAVYLDQIAAAWAKLCFDENHGHPVGGGSHWVDGYRELLKQTKEIGRRDGRETVFTTENNAEPYMDGVDAFLIWNPRNEAEIPMMTAVYSGYTLYFSSPRMQSGGPQSFWMGQARDFAWGCQLGWMSPEQFNHAGSVEGMHLKELGQYRVATRKFLTYGELLGELDLRFIGDSGFHTFPLPKVSGTWDNWTGPPQDVTLPAVQTAVWRAEDDTLGMFVVNVSDATLPCELRLDAEAYGGFESEGDWLELKRISPDGTEVAGYMPRAASRRVEVLKPNEVLVYEVAPTQKLPKLAKKADRLGPDAERARWDAWCLIRGFSWSIALPVRVAEGDHVEPSFAADAPPERGLRVRCRGMDDWEPVEGMYPVTLRRAVAGSERLFGGDRLPLAVELGDGQSTVSLTFPWEYTVAPPTEVSIEASNLRAGETSALAVRVRRNAARTGEVVIGLRVPAGWDLDPGPMLSVRDLQRGETRRVWVKVTVPRDAASVAGLEAFVIGERARASVGVDPPRPRAEASQANAPPTVDGDLGEWAEVAAVSLDPGGAREFKEYGGAEDKSGSVRMQWDQQNLYVAIEVRDQAHHQPGRHKD
ncbi:MAG TPA: DUF6259 domain-containing protein, partial [Armatimonadota bacterium]|nr:DUF6259 domain-containing protein [Armatimonadota bacterium]